MAAACRRSVFEKRDLPPVDFSRTLEGGGWLFSAFFFFSGYIRRFPVQFCLFAFYLAVFLRVVFRDLLRYAASQFFFFTLNHTLFSPIPIW